MDEPESLDRFLGRTHRDFEIGGIPHLVFDMEDYGVQAVQLYSSYTGVTTFKNATTPFCPDGSLLAVDDNSRGELAGVACSVLMKCLWLARLARPDL